MRSAEAGGWGRGVIVEAEAGGGGRSAEAGGVRVSGGWVWVRGRLEGVGSAEAGGGRSVEAVGAAEAGAAVQEGPSVQEGPAALSHLPCPLSPGPQVLPVGSKMKSVCGSAPTSPQHTAIRDMGVGAFYSPLTWWSRAAPRDLGLPLSLGAPAKPYGAK